MELQGLSRQKLTDYQAIREFYVSKDEIELTPHQERIRSYYLEIKAMLMAAQPTVDVVSKMKKDHNLNDATVYRYIKHVRAIFGELHKADKEFIRFFLWEKTKEAYIFATKKGNPKAVNDAVSNMIKLAPKDDTDMPDWDKLKQGLYPIVLDDVVRQLMLKMLQTPGKTDLTELMNQLGEVEDAEITE
jgi:hypothetical protein